jgi:predicted kinase
MRLPSGINTVFEAFTQALSADYLAMAYEFKAFTRARKIESPQQLLQVVMLYCGLDLSIRGCAGKVAQLQGYLSDTAVKKDWRRASLG